MISEARTFEAQTILMVCHGGIIRAAIHRALDLPPARIITVSPASLTIIAFPKHEPRLKVLNATIFAPVLDAPD